MLEEAREVIASLIETLEEDGQGGLDVVTEARWFLDASQPYLYAVQYRSMHTAIHNIIIFEDNEREIAVELLRYIKEFDELPEIMPLHIDSKEINYRTPDTHYDGKKLIYINDQIDNHVPDAYNA